MGGGNYWSLPLSLGIIQLDLSDKLEQERGNCDASTANTFADFYIRILKSEHTEWKFASFDCVKSKGLLSTKQTS